MVANPPDAKSMVDLAYLLDTLDASETEWAELPDPIPLFLRESRKALYQKVTEETKNELKSE